MKNNKVLRSKIGGNFWELWGIPVFSKGEDRVLGIVEDWLSEGKKRKWIATVNPEFVMQAKNEPNFEKILTDKTDLNVMDGIGLVWAKELGSIVGWRRVMKGLVVGMEIILGKYRQKVVAGSDLMMKLCLLAKKKDYGVFFLGGWGDRAKKAGKACEILNHGLRWDYSSGEPEVDNKEVVTKINRFKPQILLVAYGMKKQEEWIEKNLEKLKVGVVMGVGRSFDYYSGDLKRAPEIWRKVGLEWLYSLIREPKRWRRQLALVRFVGKVMRSTD